jgi:CDP-glucose 4,6-dehydratase
MVGQKLLEGSRDFATAWNFGPPLEGNRSVEELLGGLQRHWPAANWQVDAAPQPHEAKLLHLDSTRALTELKWHPVWNFAETLKMTAEWYQAWLTGAKIPTIRQLALYVEAARSQGLPWAASDVAEGTAARPRRAAAS